MTLLGAIIGFALQNKYYLFAASAALYTAKLYIDSRRLKAFKGPWAAQFTDLWFAKAAFGDHQHAVLAEVCDRYGDLHPSSYSIACLTKKIRINCPHRSQFFGHYFLRALDANERR